MNEIPAGGGETLFTNQYRAYETLDPALRERLEGRTVTHVELAGLARGDDAGLQREVDKALAAVPGVAGEADGTRDENTDDDTVAADHQRTATED